jgi:hypothetical protein
VIELQAALPNARVLYCSATGVSEVRCALLHRVKGGCILQESGVL